jgi:hypothetical protein
MATALTISRSLSFSGSYVKTADLETATTPIAINKSQDYTNGTSSQQCNLHVADTRAGTETIDLNSTLTDIYGTTANFATIREFTIINRQTGAGENLVITGDFVNQAFGAITSIIVEPGGIFHVSSPITGFTVTAGSQDEITVTGASYAYDIIIEGIAA